MQLVGYSLVAVADGSPIAHWGSNTVGTIGAIPNPIRLPNGAFWHAASAGDVSGDWKIVERWADARPSPLCVATGEEITFDGQRINVVRTWSVDADLAEQAIVGERQKRLARGFDYDFGDARGVHRIGTSDTDMKGWDEVSKASQAACLCGLPQTPLNIVTNSGPVTVTAIEWQQILLAAAQFRQPIWTASFALQGMSPIPANYADDTYWQ